MAYPAPAVTILGICTLLISHSASACDVHFNGELWAGKERAIGGADLSILDCQTWFNGTRLGVSYFGDEEYLYKGITASDRIQFGHTFVPYVGLGILLGAGEHEELADSDGVDNDGDSVVDEFGEQAEVYHFGAFAYPEAGVAICIKGVGFTLSAKQYYGLEFNGDVIYGIGFSGCHRKDSEQDSEADMPITVWP